jgi:hypothetical protein
LTELVTSLTVGELENVPIAKNCPLSVKLPKTIPLGMIVSERMLPPLPPDTPPGEPPVTVTVPVEVVGPLKDVAVAVMVVVPEVTAVTTPVEFTVATAGELEVQVTPVVMVWVERWSPLPKVPTTVNWAV